MDNGASRRTFRHGLFPKQTIFGGKNPFKTVISPTCRSVQGAPKSLLSGFLTLERRLCYNSTATAA
jgi:hypothetical protein